MIITVHQPQFIPWLGYFDKIQQADLFVILDSVQYKKNEWQNRNRIKTAQGPQWQTIPVSFKFPQKINTVTINNSVTWKNKHLHALTTNYSKAPFFTKYIGFFEELYKKDWENLVDINIEVISYILDCLHLKKKIVRSSDLIAREDPNGRLVDICNHFDACTYLAGRDGAKYMDLEQFKDNNIEVLFQDYQHPEYEQLYGKFEPYLSVIDLLFNHGDESIHILTQNKVKTN